MFVNIQEGRGEGRRMPFARLAEEPLTLTLSPEYRGEGTKPAACFVLAERRR